VVATEVQNNQGSIGAPSNVEGEKASREDILGPAHPSQPLFANDVGSPPDDFSTVENDG